MVDMNQTTVFCVLKRHTMMDSFRGYKNALPVIVDGFFPFTSVST